MKECKIFMTSGTCSWGECFACGWGKIKGPEPDMHKLKEKIDDEFREVNNCDRLKIFASGSFLDEKQFPRAIMKYVVKKCKEAKVKELVVESRPEFITDDILKEFEGQKLILAIGLEIADDKLLKKYNKGFKTADYIEAAKTLKKNKVGLRTYLMVGLPFVKDQSKELKKSVDFAKKYSDEIVLINTFPHRNAPIFDEWVNGKWLPLDKKQFEDIVKPFKGVEKDFDNFMFIPKFHRDKEVWIKGATVKNLMHPHFNVWQDYLVRFYDPPKDNDICFFTMCSYKKPYRTSQFFKALLGALEKQKNYDKMHIIVVSTPGVVPLEMSYRYPFDKYDWPEWDETAEIKKKYIEVTEERIYNYLKMHQKHYKKFYCYLKPDSESYLSLHNACKRLKIKLVDCIDQATYDKVKSERNPLSLPAALDKMKASMK